MLNFKGCSYCYNYKLKIRISVSFVCNIWKDFTLGSFLGEFIDKVYKMSLSVLRLEEVVVGAEIR